MDDRDYDASVSREIEACQTFAPHKIVFTLIYPQVQVMVWIVKLFVSIKTYVPSTFGMVLGIIEKWESYLQIVKFDELRSSIHAHNFFLWGFNQT